MLMMNYCNRVRDFINYALSNLRIICKGVLNVSCKRCKNKKFLNPDVVLMLLLEKKGSWRYIYVDMHMKNYMFLMIP